MGQRFCLADRGLMLTNDRNPELGLISELCRELVKLGLGVGLSDARPAVVIRTGPGNPVLLITVDASGEFFQWCDARERHPVTDPAGAAAHVAEYVRACHVGPDSGS
jgi:hypothetical protein